MTDQTTDRPDPEVEPGHAVVDQPGWPRSGDRPVALRERNGRQLGLTPRGRDDHDHQAEVDALAGAAEADAAAEAEQAYASGGYL